MNLYVVPFFIRGFPVSVYVRKGAPVVPTFVNVVKRRVSLAFGNFFLRQLSDEADEQQNGHQDYKDSSDRTFLLYLLYTVTKG